MMVNRLTDPTNPRMPDSFPDGVWGSVVFGSLDVGEGSAEVPAVVVGCCVGETVGVDVEVAVGIDSTTGTDVGPCSGV